MARIIDAPLTSAPEGSCDPRAVHGTWGALDAAARRGLAYTPEVRAKTDHLYERVKHVIPAVEWPAYAPLIAAINDMKADRNAVILAHNYMTSEIFHCVGDFRGDSLQLAREASETDAAVIVQAGVHFMAETSKILAPSKTVLIPDMRAGCSLAESITGADVRLIKERFPGVPVVTYVNTSADVKAESDVCCTSSNAAAVVEWAAREWKTDRVILLPDEFLAKNVCRGLRRFDGGVAGLRGREAPGQGRAAHRMLDERQRGVGGARRRLHPPMQSLPAHEAHHARRHLRRAGEHAPRGHDPGGRARARQAGDPAHA
jgi:quinolinate synthase